MDNTTLFFYFNSYIYFLFYGQPLLHKNKNINRIYIILCPYILSILFYWLYILHSVSCVSCLTVFFVFSLSLLSLYIINSYSNIYIRKEGGERIQDLKRLERDRQNRDVGQKRQNVHSKIIDINNRFKRIKQLVLLDTGDRQNAINRLYKRVK